MKNIHILPTDKPSRLVLDDTTQQLILINKGEALWGNRNIYITNDSEIKEGDWFYLYDADIIAKYVNVKPVKEGKKIILTTDQDLIKDGVQAIDDEFLEWFVKNPSCEEVGIQKQYQYHSSKEFYIDADYVDCTKEQYESIKKEIPTCPLRILYKIIIPKEEPKQETLEEAAEREYAAEGEDSIYCDLGLIQQDAFIVGAKWQAERMYSEADKIMKFLDTEVELKLSDKKTIERIKWYFETYFEQFKKK